MNIPVTYSTDIPAAYSYIRSAFTHRKNQDGTTDSICRRCFVTVVTASREEDLDRAEHTHCCDAKVFDRWNDMIERGKRPPRQRYQ
jgi:hypothetical protein